MDGQPLERIIPTEKDFMAFLMEGGIQVHKTNPCCMIFSIIDFGKTKRLLNQAEIRLMAFEINGYLGQLQHT